MGLPGRIVRLFVQIISSRCEGISFPGARLAATGPVPACVHIELETGQAIKPDDSKRLYSAFDGSPGPYLIQLLDTCRSRVAEAIGRRHGLLEGGKDGTRRLLRTAVTVVIDASYPYRHLPVPYGTVVFERMEFIQFTEVEQHRLQFDRGAKFDLAVAVENFVSHQGLCAFRKGDPPNIHLTELRAEEPMAREGVLVNDSLLKVYTEMSVSLRLPPDADETAERTPAIKVVPAGPSSTNPPAPPSAGPTQGPP